MRATAVSDPRPVPVSSHQHRDVSGGWLRPTVFGAMDGLITNVSLITGVGGGGGATHTIVLTGLAGLVAGSFSMATGEYISVASQNNLVHAEVDLERQQLAQYPESEEAELVEVFARHGVERRLAERVAADISKDPERALHLHTQEELGVNAATLPSPWTAATSSMWSFAAGAIVPLVPFLVGLPHLWLTLAISAVVALAGGMVLGRTTSRPILTSGARQVVLGALAVAVTFGVGRLIGSVTT